MHRNWCTFTLHMRSFCLLQQGAHGLQMLPVAPTQGTAAATNLAAIQAQCSSSQSTLQRSFASQAQAPLHSGSAAAARGGVAAAEPAKVHAQAADGTRGSGWILLLPSAFAASLGLWQLQRRSWKTDMLQQRTAALQAEPADIFAALSTPPEYTQVTAEGTFQHNQSLAIGPRPRSVMGGSRPGTLLITPLHSDAWHKAVLVNRGWVPQEWWADGKLREQGSPTQQVRVSGVVRESERRSGFVPDNAPAAGQWYWIDVPALAAACGLPADTPLVEVLSSRSGGTQHGTVPTSMDVLALRTTVNPAEEEIPLPKSSKDLLQFSVMPGDHRNYAATWFSLAAATAVLAYRAVRQRRAPLKRR